jgi:type 1 glutamine amidotransferase/nicotinamidase-related amidase
MQRNLYLLFVICFAVFVNCGNRDSFKVVLISGSNEYFSDISLANYQTYLEENFPDLQIKLLKAESELNKEGEYSNLSGLEAIDDADVAVIFSSQIAINSEQLERIKKYINSGKGIIAIRTANRGFQNWSEFDELVLGGNYHGHYPGSPEKSKVDENGKRSMDGQPEGPTQEDKIVPGSENHPILTQIGDFRSRYSLYRTSPVAEDINVLMTGKIPNEEPEPVVWARQRKDSRVVYIGLGGLQDWENSTFRRLVTNSLFWTAKEEIRTPELKAPQERPQAKGQLTLVLRRRREQENDNRKSKEIILKREINLEETAIVICDMWDKHWCRGATERCEQLAIKMNSVLKLAREKGIQIIHAPSSTMYFYDDWPQRRRMMLAPIAPKVEEAVVQEPPLPIDASDHGCDTNDSPYSAWTRQSPHIEIGESEGISDSGDEIFNFFKYGGIKNMIIMGVHTNMCVLERSFGIRQMTRRGINCILVRDLTDAMYDPNDFPYVSHEQGVELIVQHIERYLCPSMLSSDLMAALQ